MLMNYLFISDIHEPSSPTKRSLNNIPATVSLTSGSTILSTSSASFHKKQRRHNALSTGSSIASRLRSKNKLVDNNHLNKEDRIQLVKDLIQGAVSQIMYPPSEDVRRDHQPNHYLSFPNMSVAETLTDTSSKSSSSTSTATSSVSTRSSSRKANLFYSDHSTACKMGSCSVGIVNHDVNPDSYDGMCKAA